MVFSFANAATEDIFDGRNSAEARRLLPRELWKAAFRKLDQINVAAPIDDLLVPPGNRLEALKADRKGQHSIRINNKYRICFRWAENGAENVEIVDYH